MNDRNPAPEHLAAAAPAWDLDRLVADLRAARHQWRESQQRNLESGGRELPSREGVRCIVTALTGALFPMRLGPPDLRQETEDFYVGHTLDTALKNLLQQVRLELRSTARGEATAPAAIERRAVEVVRAFADALPGVRIALDGDVLAAYRGDPAAHSVDEVLLCYPGIYAVTHYRLAHVLWQLGMPLLARIVTELAHNETGIDIHPGAQIGGGFFIDHGTGVVIGETTIIGQNVRIYQAVTLGAKSFPASDDGELHKGLPRHPIVEDDVVIYAGATILGRITIGRGSTIGGNVWITRSVAAGSHVTQAGSQQTAAGSGAGGL